MKKFVFTALICLCFGLNVFAQAKTKVLKYEVPKYPAVALATRKEGEVIVSVEIDKDGKVKSTKVESGHIFLGKTSEEAISKWLFSANETSELRKVRVIFEYRIKVDNSYKNNFKPVKTKTHFKKPFRLIITTTLYTIIQTIV